MKNYKISVKVGNAKMAAGLEPWGSMWDDDVVQDVITAETEEEAILIAMDCVKECVDIRDYDVEMDEEKHEVKIYDADGDIAEMYYDFVAKEVI